jgi:hypothetical protein
MEDSDDSDVESDFTEEQDEVPDIIESWDRG